MWSVTAQTLREQGSRNCFQNNSGWEGRRQGDPALAPQSCPGSRYSWLGSDLAPVPWRDKQPVMRSCRHRGRNPRWILPVRVWLGSKPQIQAHPLHFGGVCQGCRQVGPRRPAALSEESLINPGKQSFNGQRGESMRKGQLAAEGPSAPGGTAAARPHSPPLTRLAGNSHGAAALGARS